METRIVQSNNDGIEAAIEVLRCGGIVALPTETVYGLAADATNVKAVTAIFEAKDRPLYDPLIVHVPPSGLDDLQTMKVANVGSLDEGIREKLTTLLDRYWPGPLTILLPRGEAIGDLVTAGSNWVAVRSPAHPVFQQILAGCECPLAAPSANRFGHVSPTTAQHVLDDLEGRISLVVDGGRASVGVESTIIKVNENGFELLRPGGVPLKGISSILGAVQPTASRVQKTLMAPGTLEKHYAPETRVLLFSSEVRFPDFKKGVLLLPEKKDKPDLPASIDHKLIVKVLSNSGSDAEAAQNIYACLRQVEADETCDLLVVVLPERREGLWPAIRDRLTRAAAK